MNKLLILCKHNYKQVQRSFESAIRPDAALGRCGAVHPLNRYKTRETCVVTGTPRQQLFWLLCGRLQFSPVVALLQKSTTSERRTWPS